MSSSSESHGTHDLNAPTDNLEAGAGDLVEQAQMDADAKRIYLAETNRDDWRDRANTLAAQLAAVTAENARLREALEAIRELNTTGADENGHRWAHSDLIDQEIRAVLSQEAPK